jgi:hypothetical protein
VSVSVQDLHRHLAKFQAHHKALRDHHRHVAHQAAAERAATSPAAAPPTSTPLSGTGAGIEGSRPSGAPRG